MFNTVEEAIKELSKEYKELYVVTNLITDVVTGSTTDIWNVYADKEDALRWPKLCREYLPDMYHDYEWCNVEEAEDDGKTHVIMAETYTHAGRKLKSCFVYQKAC